MSKERELRCALCETKVCRDGKDCFADANIHRALYKNEQVARLHSAASTIEARYYCEQPRLQEVILFAKELGCRKVGLAFCIGLSYEANIIHDILSRQFEVASVCCKACGVPKSSLKLAQIHAEKNEVMCNPAGQARLLNEAGTELNIVCGLCVGHDAIFGMASKMPVTTLIVKDRVLAHNPVGAVYSQYVRRKILSEMETPRTAR